MNLINVFVFGFFLLCCLGILWVLGYLTPSKLTPWGCPNGVFTPIRVNNDGIVECYSTDGKGCIWRGNTSQCNDLTKLIPENAKTFRCTDADYANPVHWCAKGKIGFNL